MRKNTWFFGIMETYYYDSESNGTVWAIVCRRLIISQGLYVFELALSNEELRFSLVNGSKWVFLALTLTVFFEAGTVLKSGYFDERLVWKDFSMVSDWRGAM